MVDKAGQDIDTTEAQRSQEEEIKDNRPPVKKPEPKENKAYEVSRPLYDKGPNWNFQEYKKHMLTKGKPPTDLLDLHYFEGGDYQKNLDTSHLKTVEDIKEHTFPTDHNDLVVMTSYPRSGNTLLRATLEKVMGIVTGSDCDISKKLNVELMNLGLAGEGLADRRIWICKTHYPERYGKARAPIDRVIMLVRSPLDAMVSLYHMTGSGSHDLSITDDDFKSFWNEWSEFVRQEIELWSEFHKYWTSLKKPVHIVRYEDIMQSREQTITDLVKFIFMQKDISGTYLEHYVKQVCGQDAPQVYKPRKGLVNGNMDKYSKELLQAIAVVGGKMLKNLGYYHLVQNSTETEGIPKWIQQWNQKSLEQCLRCEWAQDQPILVNQPAILLRRKTQTHPKGRTTIRFKQAMRNKVTIIGKSMFKVKEDDQAEEPKPFIPSEQNYKETADEQENATEAKQTNE